jgi:hypothetical protein
MSSFTCNVLTVIFAERLRLLPAGARGPGEADQSERGHTAQPQHPPHLRSLEEKGFCSYNLDNLDFYIKVAITDSSRTTTFSLYMCAASFAHARGAPSPT